MTVNRIMGKPRRMNRPPPIVVRPRKGSRLEAIQIATGNKMADTLHDWAEEDESWAVVMAENAREEDNAD